LRQDITCPNVKQKTSKEAQVVRRSNVGNREEHGRDGTGHWRYRVGQQQQEGTTRRVLIDDHQCDGIEAIGEVV